MSEDFTIEKLKIREDLTEIKSTINTLVKVHELRLDAIERNNEKLNILILGDKETTGMKADLIHLKEKSATRDKHIWALVVGVIGSFSMAVFAKFIK